MSSKNNFKINLNILIKHLLLKSPENKFIEGKKI